MLTPMISSSNSLIKFHSQNIFNNRSTLVKTKVICKFKNSYSVGLDNI